VRLEITWAMVVFKRSHPGEVVLDMEVGSEVKLW